MKYALEKELRYCHSMKEIPKVSVHSEGSSKLVDQYMTNVDTNNWDNRMHHDHQMIDQLLSMTPEKTSKSKKSDVVTYNLKDMSSAVKRPHSLNQIFTLLEKNKPQPDVIDADMQDNQDTLASNKSEL